MLATIRWRCVRWRRAVRLVDGGRLADQTVLNTLCAAAAGQIRNIRRRPNRHDRHVL